MQLPIPEELEEQQIYEEKKIRQIYEEKQFPLPLSILLPWISAQPLPSHCQDLQGRCWIEKLNSTTPSAFALAFLDYLRAELERVLAGLPDSASCVKNGQVKNLDQTKSTGSNEEQARIASSADIVGAMLEQSHRSNSHFAAAADRKSFSSAQMCERLHESEEKSYDANFPALGVANPNVSQKSNQSREKPRRRVNPTPLANPVVDSAFVFAKLESPLPLEEPDENNPKTRSSTPLKVDIDVLMRRCEKSGKLKHKLAESRTWRPNLASVARQDQSTGSSKDGVPLTSFPENAQSTTVVSTSNVLRLKRFATVHAKLINSKMVPSLVGELQYLFQLLCMGQCSRQDRDVEKDKRLFQGGEDCSLYSCIVLEQLGGRILDSVGEHILSALIQHPAIGRHSPALLLQMKGSLASHQVAALHSFKAYKVSSCIPSTHPQSNKGSLLESCRRLDVPGMPVSVPFQPARDSRNNFRSRESQKIYNNRELCRDHFYAIVRDAAAAQNSFGFANDDTWLRIHGSVKSLMRLLLVENYPWFTELFLDQVVRAAMCGETDPVVTDLARQDTVKLQRLHDRLTLSCRSGPASAKAPCSIGCVTKEITDIKCTKKTLKPKLQNLTNGTKKTDMLSEIDFTSFFPLSVRVYIWIMEAADSYRLSIQMIWNLKFKIIKLNEIPQHSRDAADIGSALTQRVITLKALACLLGFLCFFPGASVAQTSSDLSNQDCEWEMHATDPPIDIVETLERATVRESMLLTLPWVLDFLRLIKADQHAFSLPKFQKAFCALRATYSYSILDPANDNFGVASMCIIASLDRFFEFMDLPAWDIHDNCKATESSKICRVTECTGCMLDNEQATFGLDRMIGVVDPYYIQHCCPTLMNLRLLLIEGGRKLQSPMDTRKSSALHMKSIRKITPMQHPKISKPFDQGIALCLEEAPVIADSHIQIKLQRNFFEQRPELQRLVDFVVDTTAVNAARAASLRCVPPVLKEAFRKLELILPTKLQVAPHITSLGKEGKDQEVQGQIEAIVENVITSAIQQALGPAMEYAKKHTVERTSEALSALTAPDEAPFVVGIAAGIAADTAGSAACKKTFANISCDVRKHITEEVEKWRRNLRTLGSENSNEKNVQEETASSCGQVCASTALDMDIDLCDVGDSEEKTRTGFTFSTESEKLLNGITRLKQPRVDMDSLDPCLTVSAMECPVSELNSDFSGSLLQFCCPGDKKDQVGMLANRILYCCSAVSECCVGEVCNDNWRHLLRIKMAAVCTSIEGILSLKYGLPVGGFDTLVHVNVSNTYVAFSFDKDEGVISRENDSICGTCPDESASDVSFRIEKGLARRCVALSLHLCLLSPWEAFGYNSNELGSCTCASVSTSQLMDKLVLTMRLKSAFNKLDLRNCVLKSKLDSINEQSTELAMKTDCQDSCEIKAQCQIYDRFGGLMMGLLFMWEMLVRCGICEVSFFVTEFLSPWRWTLAKHSKSRKASDSWFEGVKHGIVNVLLRLIDMAQASEKVEKLVHGLLENLLTELFCKDKQGKVETLVDQMSMPGNSFQSLAVRICLEFLYLHAISGHRNEHKPNQGSCTC